MSIDQTSYYVRPRTPCPDVHKLAAFLWEGNFSYYAEDNSTSAADDESWTRLVLIHVEQPEQRVDITPVKEKPLVLHVNSAMKELSARTANFIANRTLGTVARYPTGSWRNPKMLRNDMGNFDIEAAIHRFLFVDDQETQPAYARAHRYANYHRKPLLTSDLCGCFYCLAIFQPVEVRSWIDEWDGEDQTAMCPKCGIDSVICSNSGYPITTEFLQQMNTYWFRTVMPEIIQEMQSHGFLY
jgi:hypothetical protein